MWVKLVVLIAWSDKIFIEASDSEKNVFNDVNPEKPLFITPYLERGAIDEVKGLAKNPPFVGNVESYSGLLTVNENQGMNMFFWFFPAEFRTGEEPVMVWLQGGPGATSMFGALIENGPYHLKTNGEIVLRPYSWAKNINMLYIDNPAGVGFSFTNNGTVPTNQNDVGYLLYFAVQQFLMMFPDLRRNPFYVSGESYGGKYVPALAHRIHLENSNDDFPKINLVGIAIGNGLIDPENMMVYPDHQYQLGLIDDVERKDMEGRCRKIVRHICSGEWYNASEGFREMFWNSKTQPPNLLTNNTGFTFHFNILVSDDDGTANAVNTFMNLPGVKKALHVGDLPFQNGSLAEDALHDDMMKSVLPWFVTLAENYNVLLYSGQLDIIIPHPTTVNFLKKMSWSGSAAYHAAQKKIWRVEHEVAGYSKTVRHRRNGKALHFTDLLVRSAGHIVPKDRPKMAFDMINRFTRKVEPF